MTPPIDIHAIAAVRLYNAHAWLKATSSMQFSAAGEIQHQRAILAIAQATEDMDAARRLASWFAGYDNQLVDG